MDAHIIAYIMGATSYPKKFKWPLMLLHWCLGSRRVFFLQGIATGTGVRQGSKSGKVIHALHMQTVGWQSAGFIVPLFERFFILSVVVTVFFSLPSLVLVVLSAGSCVCGLPLPTSKRPRGGPLPPAGWRSSCHVTGHPASSFHPLSFSLSQCSQTTLATPPHHLWYQSSFVFSLPYLPSCVYSLHSVHKSTTMTVLMHSWEAPGFGKQQH